MKSTSATSQQFWTSTPSRFPLEAGQMRIPEGLRGISWSQNRRWRPASYAWQGGSNRKHLRTQGASLIPKLLWEICSKPLNHSTPMQEVEMVTWMLTGIYRSKASALISLRPGTLRSQSTSHTSWQRICLLNWSCDLTQTSRRHRETNCLRFLLPLNKWTELCTEWEGSTLPHLWS